MADLLESSQQQATVAPDFYTNYLSNLAGAGTTAATNAQYVGAQPLQEKAFQAVGSDYEDLNHGDLKSKELDSTNKRSPVTGFKGYPR
jgi:hypothetical protein